MKTLLYTYFYVLAFWTAYLIFLKWFVPAIICIIVLTLIYNRIKQLWPRTNAVCAKATATTKAVIIIAINTMIKNHWKEELMSRYGSFEFARVVDAKGYANFEAFISKVRKEAIEEVINEIPDAQNLTDGTTVYGRDNRELKSQLKQRWLGGKWKI